MCLEQFFFLEMARTCTAIISIVAFSLFLTSEEKEFRKGNKAHLLVYLYLEGLPIATAMPLKEKKRHTVVSQTSSNDKHIQGERHFLPPQTSIKECDQERAQPPPHMTTASSFPRLVAVIFFYCASGTFLTLVNKLAMAQFPFPNFVITLQNAATIAMLLAGSSMSPAIFGRMPALSRETLTMWAPLATAFVIMLVSSMLALLKVSAVTLIVIRNLTAISVAALERMVLGTSVSGSAVVALLGMVGGAVAFGLHDLTFDVQGYAWLVVNMVATSCYQVMVKRIISKDASTKIGPFGFAYLNNVMSVPFLALIAVVNKEPGRIAGVMPIDGRVATTLLLSCFLGCMLSVSGFVLNTMISATSLMVANNVNKFLVIIFSELFIQRTLDGVASVGVVAVMLFGCLYAQSRQGQGTKTEKGITEGAPRKETPFGTGSVAFLDKEREEAFEE